MIVLSDTHLAAITGHAESDRSEECCGLMLGTLCRRRREDRARPAADRQRARIGCAAQPLPHRPGRDVARRAPCPQSGPRYRRHLPLAPERTGGAVAVRPRSRLAGVLVHNRGGDGRGRRAAALVGTARGPFGVRRGAHRRTSRRPGRRREVCSDAVALHRSLLPIGWGGTSHSSISAMARVGTRSCSSNSVASTCGSAWKCCCGRCRTGRCRPPAGSCPDGAPSRRAPATGSPSLTSTASYGPYTPVQPRHSMRRRLRRLPRASTSSARNDEYGEITSFGRCAD